MEYTIDDKVRNCKADVMGRIAADLGFTSDRYYSAKDKMSMGTRSIGAVDGSFMINSKNLSK